ncbi:hypothetical protein FQA39_LY02986 [Lamprigera yunnana]|nr:hypothetical protein FQA39_LY02986 [Lamprigera yunnana]
MNKEKTIIVSKLQPQKSALRGLLQMLRLTADQLGEDLPEIATPATKVEPRREFILHPEYFTKYPMDQIPVVGQGFTEAQDELEDINFTNYLYQNYLREKENLRYKMHLESIQCLLNHEDDFQNDDVPKKSPEDDEDENQRMLEFCIETCHVQSEYKENTSENKIVDVDQPQYSVTEHTNLLSSGPDDAHHSCKNINENIKNVQKTEPIEDNEVQSSIVGLQSPKQIKKKKMGYDVVVKQNANNSRRVSKKHPDGNETEIKSLVRTKKRCGPRTGPNTPYHDILDKCESCTSTDHLSSLPDLSVNDKSPPIYATTSLTVQSQATIEEIDGRSSSVKQDTIPLSRCQDNTHHLCKNIRNVQKTRPIKVNEVKSSIVGLKSPKKIKKKKINKMRYDVVVKQNANNSRRVLKKHPDGNETEIKTIVRTEKRCGPRSSTNTPCRFAGKVRQKGKSKDHDVQDQLESYTFTDRLSYKATDTSFLPDLSANDKLSPISATTSSRVQSQEEIDGRSSSVKQDTLPLSRCLDNTHQSCKNIRSVQKTRPIKVNEVKSSIVGLKSPKQIKKKKINEMGYDVVVKQNANNSKVVLKKHPDGNETEIKTLVRTKKRCGPRSVTLADNIPQTQIKSLIRTETRCGQRSGTNTPCRFADNVPQKSKSKDHDVLDRRESYPSTDRLSFKSTDTSFLPDLSANDKLSPISATTSSRVQYQKEIDGRSLSVKQHTVPLSRCLDDTHHSCKNTNKNIRNVQNTGPIEANEVKSSIVGLKSPKQIKENKMNEMGYDVVVKQNANNSKVVLKKHPDGNETEIKTMVRTKKRCGPRSGTIVDNIPQTQMKSLVRTETRCRSRSGTNTPCRFADNVPQKSKSKDHDVLDKRESYPSTDRLSFKSTDTSFLPDLSANDKLSPISATTSSRVQYQEEIDGRSSSVKQHTVPLSRCLDDTHHSCKNTNKNIRNVQNTGPIEANEVKSSIVGLKSPKQIKEKKMNPMGHDVVVKQNANNSKVVLKKHLDGNEAEIKTLVRNEKRCGPRNGTNTPCRFADNVPQKSKSKDHDVLDKRESYTSTDLLSSKAIHISSLPDLSVNNKSPPICTITSSKVQSQAKLEEIDGISSSECVMLLNSLTINEPKIEDLKSPTNTERESFSRHCSERKEVVDIVRSNEFKNPQVECEKLKSSNFQNNFAQQCSAPVDQSKDEHTSKEVRQVNSAPLSKVEEIQPQGEQTEAPPPSAFQNTSLNTRSSPNTIRANTGKIGKCIRARPSSPRKNESSKQTFSYSVKSYTESNKKKSKTLQKRKQLRERITFLRSENVRSLVSYALLLPENVTVRKCNFPPITSSRKCNLNKTRIPTTVEHTDRALAAAWIQKLRNENVGDLRLRTDYLKLLLFVLQRNKLIGTFAENPNRYDVLDDFPECKLKDVAKELLLSEEELRKQKRSEVGDSPPYVIEYSADLLEYAAAQEIPNFGVHAYYAISNDPLPLWDHTEKTICPRNIYSAVNQKAAKSPSREISASLSEPSISDKKVHFKHDSKSKTPKRHKILSPQRSPYKPEEKRTPLTWGSNLIGVSEFLPRESDDGADLILIPTSPGLVSPRPGPSASYTICPGPSSRNTYDDAIAREYAPYENLLKKFDSCEEELKKPKRSGIPQSSSPSRSPTKRQKYVCDPSYPVDNIVAQATACYSPQLPTGEENFFAESPPSFFDNSLLESQSSISDSNIYESPKKQRTRSPKQIYSPTLPEGEASAFFLEEPPSFIDDCDLPSIDSFQDPSLPLRTPSPGKGHSFQTRSPQKLRMEDLSLASLPYETPSPRQFSQKRFDEVSAGDLSVTSLPYGTPPLRYFDTRIPEGERTYSPEDPSLPLRTPSPRKRYKSPTTSYEYLQDVSLPYASPSPRTPINRADFFNSTRIPVVKRRHILKTTESSPKAEQSSSSAQDIIDDFNRQSRLLQRRRSPKNVPQMSKIDGMRETMERLQQGFNRSKQSPVSATPRKFVAKRQRHLNFDEPPTDVEPQGTESQIPRRTQQADKCKVIRTGIPRKVPVRVAPKRKAPSPKPSTPQRHDQSFPFAIPSYEGSPDQLFLETPPRHYYSPNIISPEGDPFDLPIPLKVSDLEPFTHWSSYNEEETRPTKVSPDLPKYLQNYLRSREQPNQKEWFLPVELEEGTGLLEESFTFPTTPERSPVREFKFSPTDEIQENIRSILTTTPPTSPRTQFVERTPLYEHNFVSTPPRRKAQSPKVPHSAKKSPFSQQEDDFSNLDLEACPNIEFESPQLVESPGYTLKTPPRSEYEIPPYFETPEFLKERSPKMELDLEQSYKLSSIRKSPEHSMEVTSSFVKFSDIPFESNRQGTPPKMFQVRELSENVKVEGPTKKVRRKKVKQVISTLDTVLESPIRVPTMFEVDDTTGFKTHREQLEQKYKHLPQIEYDFPEDLIGTQLHIESQNLYTPLDSSLPIHLPSPMRPNQIIVPGWTSPPHLVTSTFVRDENIPFVKARRNVVSDILSDKDYLPELQYSPPQLTLEELNQMRQQISPKAQTLSPRRQAEQSFELLEDMVFDEFAPNIEDISYESSTPTKTQAALDESTISSVESPTSLILRLYSINEPTYRDEMFINVGKTRTSEIPVTKKLKALKFASIKELPENIEEEHVPFISRVQAAKPKFVRRKKKRPISTLTDIGESPIKVPTMLESNDPTGFKRIRERLEEKFAELPTQTEVYPDELMGTAVCSSPERMYSEMDRTPPRNLPSPIRPPVSIPGWDSPPHLRTTPSKRTKTPPLLPGLAENIQVPKELRDILNQEIMPSEVMFSPPLLSPQEEIEYRSIFTTEKPKSPSMRQEVEAYAPFQAIESINEVLGELIDDEDFEIQLVPADEVFESPVSTTSRRPLSPLSPPESAMDFRIRLFETPEPYYYSKDSMEVMVGTGKKVVVKKDLQPPTMRKIKELSEDYPEEGASFLYQVEGAEKIPRRERVRFASKFDNETVYEEPLVVPRVFEADDVAKFKKIREEFEKRYVNLPTLEEDPYPEDLLDAKAKREWTQDGTELDTDISEMLSSPIRSISSVPGWETPKQFKKFERMKTPSPFKVLQKPARKENIFLETFPTDLSYTSPPPLSPEEILSRTPKQPTPRRFRFPTPKASPFLSPVSPKTPLLSFDQLQSKAEQAPHFLDLEMLPDELIYESPVTPERTPPKISMADRHSAAEATRKAFKELMEMEQGTLPLSPERSPKIDEDINKSLEEFKAMENLFALESEETERPATTITDNIKSQRQLLEMMDKISKQVKDLNKTPTYFERIENLVCDVPDSQLPRPSPLVALKPQTYSSPPWSPKLPSAPDYYELVEVEFDSEMEWIDETPIKTPLKEKTPVRVSPKQKSPKLSPKKPVYRDIFEDLEDADEYLEEMELPYDTLVLDTDSPPTPPKLEEFYQVHTPPSPGIPDDLAEQLRRHRYTKQYYDIDRQFMRSELLKSKKPTVRTIEEIVIEESVLPRAKIVREETVKAKPRATIFKDFARRQLDFASPPRSEEAKIPKKYKYYYTKPTNEEEIGFTSPPHLFADEILEEYDEDMSFPEYDIVEGNIEDFALPQRAYDVTAAQECIQTPTRRRLMSDTLETQSSPQLPPAEQNYALPRPTYYGSPGRECIRTPKTKRTRQ